MQWLVLGHNSQHIWVALISLLGRYTFLTLVLWLSDSFLFWSNVYPNHSLVQCWYCSCFLQNLEFLVCLGVFLDLTTQYLPLFSRCKHYFSFEHYLPLCTHTAWCRLVVTPMHTRADLSTLLSCLTALHTAHIAATTGLVCVRHIVSAKPDTLISSVNIHFSRFFLCKK